MAEDKKKEKSLAESMSQDEEPSLAESNEEPDNSAEAAAKMVEAAMHQ